MSRTLLVLRPEPNAAATVARAQAAGLRAVASPLFTVAPVAWVAPDPGMFDAVLLTSANAVRHGGPQLAHVATLPAFAVGATTAAAARSLFETVVVGEGDAAALVERAERSGARRLLHLCGREYRAAGREALRIERRIVYAADAVSNLPDVASEVLVAGAVALLHSPRAAILFATLVDAAGIARESIRLAAISPAALAAAGGGWERGAAAARPTDDALLAAAAGLCD